MLKIKVVSEGEFQSSYCWRMVGKEEAVNTALQKGIVSILLLLANGWKEITNQAIVFNNTKFQSSYCWRMVGKAIACAKGL